MANKFVNKDGVEITRATWQELFCNKSYYQLREYEGPNIYVEARWTGLAQNVETVPRKHWKLYALEVVNIVTTDGESGELLAVPIRKNDPTVSRQFRTEQEAIDAYEDILVRYAGCEWLPSANGQGGRQFVERDNKLVPPPPDIPDTRGMDEDIADLAGSW